MKYNLYIPNSFTPNNEEPNNNSSTIEGIESILTNAGSSIYD